MSTGSSARKRHLGVDFAIWRRESSWFWLLISPSGKDGMIGATSNEAGAISEARLSIEAMPTASRS